MTTSALDLVEDDLVTLAATMRATFAMVSGHPNYGKTTETDGEMLSDIGLILTATVKHLESIYSKLDGQELSA